MRRARVGPEGAGDGAVASRRRPQRTIQRERPDSPPGGHAFCGVVAAAAVLGDAWTLLLLRELADGPRRFKDLESSTGISPGV
ncbi:MAG TPA: winged helix-turn-helix transcriptional regulator, partial [Chloroflexota bacterium]|nr:winged helix-turn-helix transcriptional regulator [Chloroflexota bacterium]